MGASRSKGRIKPNSKIKTLIICPFCQKQFKEKDTYLSLNKHLQECGSNSTEDKLKVSMISNNILRIVEKANENRLPSPRLSKYPSLNNPKENEENDNKAISEDNENNDQVENNQEELCSFIAEQFSEQKNKKIKIVYKNDLDLFSQFKEINIFINTIDIVIENNLHTNAFLSIFLEKYFEFNFQNNNFSKINGKSLAFNFEAKIDWELLGKTVSVLIIYPNLKFKFKFPNLICKIILEQSVDLNDLQYLDKDLYDNLSKMKNDDSIENQNVYFEINGEELIEGGKDLLVNEHNVGEYIERRASFELRKFDNVITAIKIGLFGVIPKNIIELFSVKELYNLINRLNK